MNIAIILNVTQHHILICATQILQLTYVFQGSTSRGIYVLLSISKKDLTYQDKFLFKLLSGLFELNTLQGKACKYLTAFFTTKSYFQYTLLIAQHSNDYPIREILLNYI